MVHPGDDNSASDIKLAKYPVRSYYSACQTFVDLIDDSESPNPQDQKLRLRGGTRRPWTPGELRQSLNRQVAGEIDTIYRSERGLFWPPDQKPSDDLADLYAILNPPGHLGNVQGSWDERSILYTTGGAAEDRALVFVTCDPAIRLAGTASYPGDLAISRPGSWAHSNSTKAFARGKDRVVGTAGQHPTLPPSATACPRAGPGSDAPLQEAFGDVQEQSWRTFQPAMYREISRGYHFACVRLYYSQE
jgi:hypothetical protein